MRTPPFELLTPESLDEAISLAAELENEGKRFDWVGGGTDLIPNYKWGLNPRETVISLARIDGMDDISAERIGAMARLHDVANSDEVHPLIAKAAATVASVMIRRSATVGGNICLDTRCFWYNQSVVWRKSIDWCHKCDCGTAADCRVIQNQNEVCVATYQADLAPALLCLDATIHTASPTGVRALPLSEFFTLDGIKRNVLAESELVTHVSIPAEAAKFTGEYLKLSQRKSWDFPEAGVAVAASMDDNGITDLRVATTGVESIPRLHTAEVENALMGGTSEMDIEGLASAIRKSAKPVNNTGFPPNYRRKMVEVLARRCLESVMRG